MENANTTPPSKEASSSFSQVFGYFFRKKNPDRANNFNIRAMHTINKISILMFLIGVIMVIVKISSR